jgi:hypothetical protein
LPSGELGEGDEGVYKDVELPPVPGLERLDSLGDSGLGESGLGLGDHEEKNELGLGTEEQDMPAVDPSLS